MSRQQWGLRRQQAGITSELGVKVSRPSCPSKPILRTRNRLDMRHTMFQPMPEVRIAFLRSQTANHAPRCPALKCRTMKTNIHVGTNDARDEVEITKHALLPKVGKSGVGWLKHTSGSIPNDNARSVPWCTDMERQLTENPLVQISALAKDGACLDGDLGKLTIEDQCEIARRTKPITTRKRSTIPIIMVNVHILVDHHVVARHSDHGHDYEIGKAHDDSSDWQRFQIKLLWSELFLFLSPRRQFA